MSSGASPTLLIPIGTLGDATLTSIRKTLGASDDGVRTHRLEEGQEALKLLLEDLLRVGRTPRLDVLVFVDALEPIGDKLLQAVTVVSKVLYGNFGRVFPATAAPDQRAATLQVVLYTPALTDSAATNQVLDAIEGLLTWNQSAPHPTLSRIWLAAQQTSAGVLSPADLVSQGTGFALSLLGAGIRDSDAVQQRLAHPDHDGERLGFLSVGTLDLPLGRVEAWGRTRAGYGAMNKLVERTAAGEGRLRGLEPELLDRWLAPFESSPEAEALKSAAWKLAGGKELPERVTLGALDGPASVRARYEGLYAAPVATGMQSTAISDALKALDGLHANVVADLHNALDAPFAGRLGEVRPLADLPALEHTLEQLRRRVEVRRTAAAVPAQTPQGPALEELQAATDAIPTQGSLRMLGLATALAVGFLVLGLSTGLLLRPPPAAAAGMTSGVRISGVQADPLTASHVVPWIGALASGGVAGTLVMLLAGRRSRSRLLELLKARAEAQRAVRSAGLASGPSAEAAARLALHRSRIQTDARRAVEVASTRVQTIREALLQCRAILRKRLDGFGVPPLAVPEAEDLAPLFEPETPFHAHLLGPEATRDWVRRARRFADDDVLADTIVDGSMPKDGLQIDVPASDPDQVLELASVQTQALRDTSLFDDPTATAEIATRAERFARAVTASLAPGCHPLGPEGIPVPGLRPGATFVVGPADGRGVIEGALARSQSGISEQYWTRSAAPMVIFVRTWEGYSLDQLRRGVKR